MICKNNYDTVLCASRHDVLNSMGEKIEDSIFPEVCKLNVQFLDEQAKAYLETYSATIKEKKQTKTAILNVYVTGFSPALVSLVNVRNTQFKQVNLVLWHYNLFTGAYTPQVVL